nr:unnamed protein product [Spirometra erinaceieuropaei]
MVMSAAGLQSRLMPHQLPLREAILAPIMSAYVVPITSSDEAKTNIHDALHAILATMPEANKLFDLANFHARFGKVHTGVRRVLYPHGLAGFNENGPFCWESAQNTTSS